MKHSKKNKLSKVSANGASILERYRQLKSERSASGLSQKIMEITRAGESIDYPQAICITCDTSDVCTECDWNDLFCIYNDDTGWCVYTDGCDVTDHPEFKDLPPEV